jgi:aerobic carbon-monoxide dehydrogenase medium subunit
MLSIDLHEPASVDEALELLRRLGRRARVMAGGTDLLVDLKGGRLEAEHVVSLRRIAGMSGIERPGDGGARIGALTTIAELEASPLLTGPYSIIREAAREMASPQIRNMATIGGNVAGAVPCADLPPALGVLDAMVELWSLDGTRHVELPALFTGPRATVRREDEILGAITVPLPPPRFGAAYARFALRDGNAIAVASVAASITLDEDGTIASARMMLGAVAPTPKPVPTIEAVLCGCSLDERTIEQAAHEAMAAAQPITDLRGSAEYRRELIGVLARRALATAHERAENDHG